MERSFKKNARERLYFFSTVARRNPVLIRMVDSADSNTQFSSVAR
jgi:hypothetical protein